MKQKRKRVSKYMAEFTNSVSEETAKAGKLGRNLSAGVNFLMIICFPNPPE